ncbi:chemotaxis protein MotB [Maricaulis sp. W15]|uniref:Chemotaxis protein MotB n=1 Tax=Maricaulis maris TaxID=74318 RepID=A0A495DLV3_9PROT|nr:MULTISPECIES: flagellar motor protein MotB [Maricaulis]OLF72971.1 chemotaxis protein MotB [Maricaulis sp. W15]RKR02908.1 chemotaxis protein MotB [Maricaulis maris]
MAASDRPIVIKKVIKGGGGGHHGGAWKVAYADFVTAMMAFFLLMWLINTTTPEQKRGIADYFAPASVSPSNSGSGAPLAGTSPGDDGVQGSGDSSMRQRLAPTAPQLNDRDRQQSPEGSPEAVESESTVMATAMAEARQRRDAAELHSAAMSLRQAMQDMPELAELSNHVLIDETPEGLRIQLVDQEGRPMFDPGAVTPNERAITLLRAVARIAERLPNRLSIAGHTDSAPSAPGADYTNWELSADRANASRAVLQRAGITDDRIYEVRGKAGSEPLYPDDPYMPGNRRISVVLLREAPVLPSGHEL